MKKIVFTLAVFASMALVARPHGSGFYGSGPRDMHPPKHGFHVPKHSRWGKGGRGFWPGFAGGIIGGAVRPIIAPLPPPPPKFIVAPPPPQ